MLICAWYASCKRNATKPFLVPAEECLCKSLHTLYLFILSSQVKNGKETAPARRRFLPSPERGGYPRRIFYEWSDQTATLSLAKEQGEPEQALQLYTEALTSLLQLDDQREAAFLILLLPGRNLILISSPSRTHLPSSLPVTVFAFARENGLLYGKWRRNPRLWRRWKTGLSPRSRRELQEPNTVHGF